MCLTLPMDTPSSPSDTSSWPSLDNDTSNSDDDTWSSDIDLITEIIASSLENDLDLTEGQSESRGSEEGQLAQENSEQGINEAANPDRALADFIASFMATLSTPNISSSLPLEGPSLLEFLASFTAPLPTPTWSSDIDLITEIIASSLETDLDLTEGQSESRGSEEGQLAQENSEQGINEAANHDRALAEFIAAFMAPLATPNIPSSLPLEGPSLLEFLASFTAPLPTLNIPRSLPLEGPRLLELMASFTAPLPTPNMSGSLPLEAPHLLEFIPTGPGSDFKRPSLVAGTLPSTLTPHPANGATTLEVITIRPTFNRPPLGSSPSTSNQQGQQCPQRADKEQLDVQSDDRLGAWANDHISTNDGGDSELEL